MPRGVRGGAPNGLRPEVPYRSCCFRFISVFYACIYILYCYGFVLVLYSKRTLFGRICRQLSIKCSLLANRYLFLISLSSQLFLGSSADLPLTQMICLMLTLTALISAHVLNFH